VRGGQCRKATAGNKVRVLKGAKLGNDKSAGPRLCAEVEGGAIGRGAIVWS